MGELGLDGLLYPIKGVLAMAIQAKAEGYKGLILPYQNVKEAEMVDNLAIYPFTHLQEVVQFLQDPSAQNERNTITSISKRILHDNNKASSIPDFEEIKGQIHAKRAL
jgi:magnesium chelatase family protein